VSIVLRPAGHVIRRRAFPGNQLHWYWHTNKYEEVHKNIKSNHTIVAHGGQQGVRVRVRARQMAQDGMTETHIHTYDPSVFIWRLFLILARYVPNVAKRSIWDQCNKKKYTLTTDRRTDQPHTWGNFKWSYLREGSSDPLHVWFYGGVFEVGGSNGANSGLTKFNRYVGENNARGVIRLVTI